MNQTQPLTVDERVQAATAAEADRDDLSTLQRVLTVIAGSDAPAYAAAAAAVLTGLVDPDPHRRADAVADGRRLTAGYLHDPHLTR